MEEKDTKDNFVPTGYSRGNGIDEYDYKTSKNLTSYRGVTSKNVSYKDFVRAALSNKNIDQIFYFGRVSKELAYDIYQNTGLQLEGFNIVSASSDIRHSMKRHSDPVIEERRGQLALNIELLAKLPEVYNKPDVIRLADHKDSRGRNILRFEKRINGTIIIADAISNGRNRLSLDTMYMKRNHPVELDVLPQAQRSERSIGKASFANSISTINKEVNENESM